MSEVIRTRAHGRVNLIGEHTDYNGGWVLPTAIPQYTEVELTRRPGKKISVASGIDPKKGCAREESFNLGEEKKQNNWLDYLQGGTKILSEVLEKKGLSLSGFSVSIHSSVPEGSGLSSSAALEISFLKAIREAFKLPLTDIELALIGQRIENEFVGARVGIMDQMATCLASQGEALFLDTKTLTYERVPLPLQEIDLMVINSGLAHQLSATDGGYNERRAQCEEAAKILQVDLLRDATLEDLNRVHLPEKLRMRARHVITENKRVHEAVVAIKERNFLHLGDLFYQSHRSMKDNYQVSIPEIDLLVELCRSHDEVYGARLTGGGFGGSIVAVTKKGKARIIAPLVASKYRDHTGHGATILV